MSYFSPWANFNCPYLKIGLYDLFPGLLECTTYALQSTVSAVLLWRYLKYTLYDCKYGVHREIVPPRETMAIARVSIAIVGRGGWGSLPYTVANENQMKA